MGKQGLAALFMAARDPSAITDSALRVEPCPGHASGDRVFRHTQTRVCR